jgi:NAD(P)-dependent dehydrogenase (short-subunit alcohol dehydrogenase family)
MVDSWTPPPVRLFDLSGRVAVITGATGVLGGAMARGLAMAGARVGVLGRRKERAEDVAGSEDAGRTVQKDGHRDVVDLAEELA